MTHPSNRETTITIPDLLNAVSRPPEDIEAVVEALQFAFSTGDSAGALKEILNDVVPGDSAWNPADFSEDLFIDAFLENNVIPKLKARNISLNRRYLKNIICHPPRTAEDVRFRQKILFSLCNDRDVRARFESLYRQLIELRDNLDVVSPMGRVYFGRWRLDILEQIKSAVETLAGSFEEDPSGLCRIAAYGKEFENSAGYRLLKEFFDYEGRLATLNLSLRIASDGTVRDFKIDKLTENKKNRFHQGPFQRFLYRLSMLFRGYRVTNEELLARWADTVFEIVLPELSYLCHLIGQMEFYLAAIYFRESCREAGLSTCIPELVSAGQVHRLIIEDLFNPLLIRDDFETPKPCAVEIEGHQCISIITGPNSGGKTRLLQSMGLFQTLAQSGFATPAKSAQFHIVANLFVSLLDGARPDQKEGRLGTELLRVRSLFERSAKGAMIILDELCSGTNPSEGEEIFLLVISLLPEMEPCAFISTHFLKVAAQLSQETGMNHINFIQVELDEFQSSTYQFVPGVAATSLARHIASKLGVTREELAELIRRKE